MKTLFLEITAEGLAYRTEKGEARLLQVGDSVRLDHPSGTSIRFELLGDYRKPDAPARSPSTNDVSLCLFDAHKWVEQPAGGPIETPFAYCSACGALGDAEAAQFQYQCEICPRLPDGRAQVFKPFASKALADSFAYEHQKAHDRDAGATP